MPIPMIASDMTITSTSIVSHVGMRFAGWVIACALAAHVMCRMAQVAMNEFTCLDGTPMKGSLQNSQFVAVAAARLAHQLRSR